MDGTKMSKSKGNLIAPRALLRHGGGRRAAALPPLRGAAGRRHGLDRPDRPGHRGLRAVPGPPLAHLVTGRAARRRAGRADPADGPRRAPGHPPHHRRGDRRPRAVVLQHRGGPLHGAAQPGPALRAPRGSARPHADGAGPRRVDALLLLLAPWPRTSRPSSGSAATPASRSCTLQPWPTFDPDAGPPRRR